MWGRNAGVCLLAVYQARKQRTDIAQGCATVRAGKGFPILLCVYIQSVITAHASGKSCVFYPDQTGLSPQSLKMKTFLTLYYKIDFLSPFHSDNRMKNTFSSDLTPSAL